MPAVLGAAQERGLQEVPGETPDDRRVRQREFQRALEYLAELSRWYAKKPPRE